MIRIRSILLSLTLLFGASIVNAASPQSELDSIVEAIQQADQLVKSGKERQAAAGYELARKSLLELRHDHPDLQPDVVTTRMNYLDSRLAAWDGARFSDVAPVPTSRTAGELSNRLDYLERVNAQYAAQLQQLHEENARLSMKLREALGLRPAAEEPAVIAATQERLQNAEAELKTARAEVEKLKKELAEYPEPEEAKKNVQLLAETRKNLNQVVGEAEELRKANAILRKETAVRAPESVDSEPELHREILAAHAAQRMAEEEVARLRGENETLNRRLIAGEARQARAAITGTSRAIAPVDSARLALSQGDTTEAERVLKEALKDDPENAELSYLMGRTYALENKLAEAEASLKKSLEHSPDSGVTHFELARVYHAMDSTNSGLARWHYHKAVNLGFPRDAAFEAKIHWEQPGG